MRRVRTPREIGPDNVMIRFANNVQLGTENVEPFDNNRTLSQRNRCERQIDPPRVE